MSALVVKRRYVLYVSIHSMGYTCFSLVSYAAERDVVAYFF